MTFQTAHHSTTFSFHNLLKKDSTSADLIFGSIGGFGGRLIEHPFDTVKVRLQTTNDFLNARDCFKKTFQSQGINGFYKGLSSPLYGSIFENAVIFASYTFFQNQINNFYNQPKESDLTLKQLCLAGALSGATISFIMTPVELIKCNLQVQDLAKVNQGKLKYSGPMGVIFSTIKYKGFTGLFQGQVGTLMREAVGNAAWFGAYETACTGFIKRKQSLTNNLNFSKKNLSNIELMTAGALAGMSYQAAFFPADVVKSRQQTQEVLTGLNRNFWDITKDLYKEQGIRGFFRGFNLTILRSAPTSA
ncbi:hypothetical protein HK099_004843, partial [Clydaea vesicula]